MLKKAFIQNSMPCLWASQLVANIAVHMFWKYTHQLPRASIFIQNCLCPFIISLYILYLLFIFLGYRLNKSGLFWEAMFQDPKSQIMRNIFQNHQFKKSYKKKLFFAYGWTATITVLQAIWLWFLMNTQEKQCNHIIGQFVNIIIIMFVEPRLLRILLSCLDECRKKTFSELSYHQNSTVVGFFDSKNGQVINNTLITQKIHRVNSALTYA